MLRHQTQPGDTHICLKDPRWVDGKVAKTITHGAFTSRAYEGCLKETGGNKVIAKLAYAIAGDTWNAAHGIKKTVKKLKAAKAKAKKAEKEAAKATKEADKEAAKKLAKKATKVAMKAMKKKAKAKSAMKAMKKK